MARNNRWEAHPGRPPLKVYNGGIKHVLYIIKENRTYDEVFGDLPQGNGDPKLCSLGEKVMPNHRKLAREFTLFDNGYVSGTNSADGHAWFDAVPGQRLPRALLRRLLADVSGRRRLRHVDLQRRRPLGRRAQEEASPLRVWGEFCDDKLADLRPEAEGLVRAVGGSGQGDAPLQVHRRYQRRQPQAADQSRGALLAPAPERPVPRRRVHPRIRGVQPQGHRPRPDDHEPPLRPQRGDRPASIRPRAP